MGSARHFWSLLSSLGGVALHPWSTLSPYLGMFGDLGWLVGSLWLCLAVIFVHTMSACAGRSAALSRDQMEMLDSLSLFKPVESRKRSPSWFLPLKQLLNFHYYIHLGSMLGFWIASIFSLPRNYHSSHHLPTISLLCSLFLSQFSTNSWLVQQLISLWSWTNISKNQLKLKAWCSFTL